MLFAPMHFRILSNFPAENTYRLQMRGNFLQQIISDRKDEPFWLPVSVRQSGFTAIGSKAD